MFLILVSDKNYLSNLVHSSYEGNEQTYIVTCYVIILKYLYVEEKIVYYMRIGVRSFKVFSGKVN